MTERLPSHPEVVYEERGVEPGIGGAVYRHQDYCSDWVNNRWKSHAAEGDE